jgi:hypothetical protein
MLVVFWMGTIWDLIKGHWTAVGKKKSGVKGKLKETIDIWKPGKARQRIKRGDPEGGGT